MSNLFVISVNLIQAHATHPHYHFAEFRDRRDNKGAFPLGLVQGTKRHMCKTSPASYLHSTLNGNKRCRTLWLLSHVVEYNTLETVAMLELDLGLVSSLINKIQLDAIL